MTLVPSDHGRRDVTVASTGQVLQVRALSLVEVRQVRTLSDNDADITAIALATGLDTQEVRTWFLSATPGDVQSILRPIFEMSGLVEGAGFPGATGNDAGIAQPAV